MRRFNITPEGLGEVNFETNDNGEYVLYEDVKEKMNISLRDALKKLFVHTKKELKKEIRKFEEKRNPRLSKFKQELAKKYCMEKFYTENPNGGQLDVFIDAFNEGRKYPDYFLGFRNKEELITFLASFYEFIDENTYNINGSDESYYVDAAVDFVQELIEL